MMLVNLTEEELNAIYEAAGASNGKSNLLFDVCRRAKANQNETRDAMVIDMLGDAAIAMRLSGEEKHHIEWLKRMVRP